MKGLHMPITLEPRTFSDKLLSLYGKKRAFYILEHESTPAYCIIRREGFLQALFRKKTNPLPAGWLYSDAPAFRTDAEYIADYADALFGKGLGRQHKLEQALADFDRVVAHCSKKESPEFKKSVAGALLHKGFILYKMYKEPEARAAYEEVITRYGNEQAVELKQAVAEALIGKGNTFEWDDLSKAVSAYDDVVRRFSSEQSTELKKWVAGALIRKGNTLKCNNPERDLTPAMHAYDEVIERFGNEQSIELKKYVAEALISKGNLYKMYDKLPEAVAAFEEVTRRFEGEEAAEMKLLLAEAQCYHDLDHRNLTKRKKR